MATFRDREVFEFCEKTFEELKRQDNGYFPHKHLIEHQHSLELAWKRSIRYTILIPRLLLS